MAIKLNFDPAGNLEMPTLVLALKSGKRLGVIQSPQDLIVSDSFGNAPEFSFSVIKNLCSSWYLIRNLRLIWVREWDKWFELTVDINESDKSIKNIIATHLPEAELSQINLYGVEINTEADIDREDYLEPTIFYNETNPEASLLHRITKDAVNITFGHIDISLCRIQRTFTFDKKDIYGAFKEIEEEIGCHFEFNSYTENGKIVREVSAYDLMNFCNDCGKRFEHSSTCPKCGGKNIRPGYGEDTSVFLSLDNALDSVTYTTNVDSIKNCIRLEAGDDLMTDTIRLCNPNGTNQLIYFHEDTLADMSEELKKKIASYMDLYNEYTNTREYNVDVLEYNNLVSKYSSAPYDAKDIEFIETPVVGFSALMNAMYDAIDMELFLNSKLLPSPENDEYTASGEIEKLTNQLKTVAIQGTVTVSSATNAVLAMSKAIIMSGYQIKISDEKLSNKRWTGKITVTNYSDDEDTANATLTVTVNNNYEEFVHEQIQKVLAKGDSKNYGIVSLFENDLAEFKTEIKKYGLQPLLGLKSSCEGVIGILAEQGILNKSNYDTLNALDPDANKHLYNEVALPYLDKQTAVNAEILVRENEIAIVAAIQEVIEKIRADVQKQLNFEEYVGNDLWSEFSSFRRDDVYSNSNYSSEGLDNAEIFRLANEFLEVANKEVRKAATPQHSISVTMKNILIMPEFAPMKEKFSVGNWIRVEANEEVHRLRLLSYEFNYGDFTGLPVTFSDVVKIADDISDINGMLQNAQSMATSFDYVAKQASNGNESYKVQENWVQKGLDATALNIMNNADDQTMYFDRYGFLMRRTNDFTGDYDPKQLKFINTTLAMTDDNWRSVKTAVGLFQYIDPVDGILKEAWGVNGELLIGKLILGESLGIYNESGTLKFNHSGLTVTNGTNTFNFDPNSPTLLSISNTSENILYVDDTGVLCIKGDVISSGGYIGNWKIGKYTIHAQKSTQKTQTVTKPVTDENGEIVYDIIYVYDENGSPVYETDEKGDIIYETQYVYDETGEPIYETDENGNVIYEEVETTDEEGNVVIEKIEKILTVQIPIQKTIKEIVYEEVEETVDTFYDTYTVLSSNDKSIAIAIGVETVDEDGIPVPSDGKLLLYNNGHIKCARSVIYNKTTEPNLYMLRDRSDKTIAGRIYMRASDNPQFAIGFMADRDNDDTWTYSCIIDRDGIRPYTKNTRSIGLDDHRWNYIFANNININKSVVFPSDLYMKDTLGRKKAVLMMRGVGETNYGSNLLMTAGGNTIVGSGNAPITVYKTSFKDSVAERLVLCSDTNIQFYVGCQEGSTDKLVYLDANMYFKPSVTAKGSIGTSSLRWNNAYFEHSPTVTSDARHKRDIQPIYKAKELIMSVEPCQFRFVRDEADRIHYGLISQRFKETIDKLGIESCGAWTCDLTSSAKNAGKTLETATEDEKMYGMRYEELIAPLIQVVQEQQKEINELKEMIRQYVSA